MIFRIHLQYGEYTDYIDIEGEDIEDIREQALKAVESRNPTHWWSEEIK